MEAGEQSSWWGPGVDNGRMTGNSVGLFYVANLTSLFYDLYDEKVSVSGVVSVHGLVRVQCV